jgi:hypothetical protein
MKQRTAIEFRVKLKETATENFEMLENSYGEECLSMISGFNGMEGSKKGSES